jgi:hypothetical protein
VSRKWTPIWGWIRWYGALLGAVIVFALARNLDEIVKWASILGFFVALIGLLISTAPHRHAPRPGLAVLLDQAAEDLALAVTQQWRAEERLRRLHDPFPLPVRWTTADAMVADHWGNIRMQPGREAAEC